MASEDPTQVMVINFASIEVAGEEVERKARLGIEIRQWGDYWMFDVTEARWIDTGEQIKLNTLGPSDVSLALEKAAEAVADVYHERLKAESLEAPAYWN